MRFQPPLPVDRNASTSPCKQVAAGLCPGRGSINGTLGEQGTVGGRRRLAGPAAQRAAGPAKQKQGAGAYGPRPLLSGRFAPRRRPPRAIEFAERNRRAAPKERRACIFHRETKKPSNQFSPAFSGWGVGQSPTITRAEGRGGKAPT